MAEDKTFKLELIAPDEVVFSKDVVSITAPGSEGSFGILANHAPFMTSLDKGELKIKEPGQKDLQIIDINKGFLEVLNNKVVVLVDKLETEPQK
tara:strand:+ start:8120 stop:8401 length:282 start_codon:yes stop_codon:yes gene_type:complete